MTLREMSVVYTESAGTLRLRIRMLRALEKDEPDRDAAGALRARIAALEPLAREMGELAQLTARYYERGYHRNEKYIL